MPGRIALCLSTLLCLSLGAQSVITRNTKRVGFVPLPGATCGGTWGYRTATARYCLQTRTSSGLAIIDTTDPSNPRLVATVAGNYRKAMVYKNYAIVTSDLGPTSIIDLAKPAQPTVAGSLSLGGHTLRVDGTRLYLNRTTRGLQIFGLEPNPPTPRFLGAWAGYAHDCRPVGNVCYVNGFRSPSTYILDVTNPAQLGFLGGVPAGNHSSDFYVTPTGRRVLVTADERVGGHCQLYDVTNPGSVFKLGAYQSSSTLSIHDVEVKGVYAYLAYYKDQLRVLDLSDPTNPVEVGAWDNNPQNSGPLFSDAWDAYPYHDAVYLGQMLKNVAGPQGVHMIDFFPAFGAGSRGTGGVVPEIWWSFGPPSPGNRDFALRLMKAAPYAQAFLVLGASRTRWYQFTLPLSLGLVGAPNCKLYVSPDVIIPVITDARGNVKVPLPVPPGVPYLHLYGQWLVLDRGAPNAARLAVTAGGHLILH